MDTDGLRKHGEEQFREVQRAWSDLEVTIATIEGDITAIESDIAAIEGDVVIAEADIVKLKTAAASMSFYNVTLVESHASNAVTFAVKTLLGVDPSAADPAVFNFPNGSGGFTTVNVTAALSIVVPSGATLGTTSAVGCRVWIAAFNDAGTVRLAVRVCSTSSGAPNIRAPLEHAAASSTLTPASTAHVFYTTGSAVTSKYWMWVGFASYESGLATAGLWAVSPTTLSLVGNARPGAVVQRVFSSTNGSLSLTATTTITDITGASIVFTMSSTANIARFSADGTIYLRSATANQQGVASMYRDAVSLNIHTSNVYTAVTTDSIGNWHAAVYDRPNTLSSVTYKVRAGNALATGLIQYTAGDLLVEEFMG
jgi:hypothetical protein